MAAGAQSASAARPSGRERTANRRRHGQGHRSAIDHRTRLGRTVVAKQPDGSSGVDIFDRLRFYAKDAENFRGAIAKASDLGKA